MPIPSQPTTNISLGPSLAPTNRSISNEFGEAQPSHALSQFYRGGSFVANHPINNGVPTSGSIAMSQFNGSSIVLRYTISASTQNFNLFNYATSAQRQTGQPKSQGYMVNEKLPTGPTGAGYGIELTINPGVTIGSATATQSAFVTGANDPTGQTGFHPSVAIVVINRGSIRGAGGPGGFGADGQAVGLVPTIGTPGGTALTAQRAISVNNSTGIITGGGGGGGGGTLYYPLFPNFVDGGGGGGGGAGSNTPPNTGGAGATGGAGGIKGGNGGQPGQAGTLTTGGNGGTGGGPPPIPAAFNHNGGPGGAAPPTHPAPIPSMTGTTRDGTGGAAGFYAKGDANITWIGPSQGTRQGQVQPTV